MNACARVYVSTDSTVLAYVMKALNDRYNYGLELFLLSIDEGITGYRDDSLEVRLLPTFRRSQPYLINADSEKKSGAI